MKKNYFLAIFALAISTIMISCNQSPQAGGQEETSVADDATPLGQASIVDEDSRQNILQIAIGSADHTTLVAAVQTAKIEHVLANNGPLTVFAPTNEAFAKLPEGTVENLLKEENLDDLARILKLHAAPGTYPTKFLRNDMELYMATGDYLKIEKNDQGVFINGAKILGTVEASNGLIHVIDAVLLSSAPSE